MKLDLSVVKNESVIKFEKSLKKVRRYFDEMLFLSLSTAAYEIDADKKKQVEVQLQNILDDEFNKSLHSFHICMNKASSLIENSLGD